jgi:hypothetical protein
MEPFARTSRAVWWAFAGAGVLALVAAAAVGLALAPALVATGAWQLTSSILMAIAIARAPGLRPAVPFVGVIAAGTIFGLAGLLAHGGDERIALIVIGIWSVLAGAGCLAISRFARAFRVPDGGLYSSAWLSIGVGVAASTLPAFGLGGTAAVPAAALTATGFAVILNATRLRTMPDSAPAVLSKREQRRRERGGQAG